MTLVRMTWVIQTPQIHTHFNDDSVTMLCYFLHSVLISRDLLIRTGIIRDTTGTSVRTEYVQYMYRTCSRALDPSY